jgi:hypothetical protein
MFETYSADLKNWQKRDFHLDQNVKILWTSQKAVLYADKKHETST